ncbi:MAG: hypothetical protein HYV97_10370 [Bdellovibrio sp.]|nr:hypothetical protein [Bdellovibrio sp.]
MHEYDDENKLYISLSIQEGTSWIGMIQALKKIRAEILSIRFVDDVYDLSSAQYPKAVGPHFKLESFLLDNGELRPESAGYLDNQLFQGMYMSKEHNAFLMTIVFKSNFDRRLSKNVLAEIESILKLHQNSLYTYHLLGDLYQQTQFQLEIQRSNLQVLPIFILLILLSFYYFFRSWGVSAAALFIIGMSYLGTVLFIAWWEKSLSPLASMSLFFVFVIATSDLVHYFTALQRKGEEGAALVFWPCFMTSLTTFIGLASLLFSEIVPVFNFGLYCCCGTVVAFVCTFYFLPILIKIFNIKITSVQSNRDLVQPHLLYKYIKPRRWKIVLTYFILGILSIACLSRLTFQDSFLEVFTKDHPLTKSVEAFRRDYGFAGNLELLLLADSEKLESVEYQELLQNLDQELRALDNVTGIASATVIRQFIQASTPPGQGDVENSLRSMRDSGLFKNLFPFFKNQMRWIVRLRSLNSQDIEKTSSQISTILAKPKYREFFGHEITGYTKVRLGVMVMIFESFYSSLLLTVLGIFLCFTLYFKSFRIAIFAMVPNLFPLVAMYGIAAYFNVPIDYNLIILNSAVMGIGVDDSIHFLHHLLNTNNRTMLESRVKRSLYFMYAPMTRSTYLFLWAFPTFFITDFRLFHNIAIFLMVGLFLALVADVVFNPAFILILRDGKFLQKKISLSS